jgi:parvulin-like peptidyl-prolyl isomerase
MATTKTAKKVAPASKKTTVKKKSTAKVTRGKNTVSSMKVAPQKKGTTVSDLRNKVLDPKNRRSLILAIIVIVLAVAVFFGKSLVIAATVNGQPISRLAIIKDLETQSGKATLDSIITRTLVYQEANKKNISVTEKDIDGEVSKIQKQFQAQGQNLDALLATQGLTRERFRDEVKVQLLVTKILGDQAKVTDKEFSDFLEKNKDLIANEKDQEAAKKSLRQQMEKQKLAQKYQEWIAKVKKNAKINYFVNY